MSNLQKTLDALQPYVIGIRYLDGIPLIDCIFKEGWTLPESNLVTKVKGSEEMNYYMVYSEKDGIGLDELLEYASTVIKVNIEREKKHELLKERVNELKELFKKTSLLKLKNLKFVFTEDDLIPDIGDLNLEETTNLEEKLEEPIEVEKPSESANIFEEEQDDDDAELVAEESRAENFKKYQESIKKNKTINSIKNKVELPPKASIQEVISDKCDCNENEACNKCIETKDL